MTQPNQTTLTDYLAQVNLLLETRYGITTRDCSEEKAAACYRTGETAEECVQWIAEKYNLTDLPTALEQMQTPNEHGVYPVGKREEIARYGRSYATVEICHCDDGLYRYGLSLSYSIGGFRSPIMKTDEGLTSYNAAKEAGIKALLQQFPAPWSREPQSIPNDLRKMKEQIEVYFLQPSLF